MVLSQSPSYWASPTSRNPYDSVPSLFVYPIARRVSLAQKGWDALSERPRTSAAQSGASVSSWGRTPRAWAGTRSGQAAEGIVRPGFRLKVFLIRLVRLCHVASGGFSSSRRRFIPLPTSHRIPCVVMEKTEPGGAVNTTWLGGSLLCPTDPRGTRENDSRIKLSGGRADASIADRSG